MVKIISAFLVDDFIHAIFEFVQQGDPFQHGLAEEEKERKSFQIHFTKYKIYFRNKAPRKSADRGGKAQFTAITGTEGKTVKKVFKINNVTVLSQ